MINLRPVLVVGCLLLAAYASGGRAPRGDAIMPPPLAGDDASPRNGPPINPSTEDSRSNSTRDDRLSCRRACERDNSVCMDTSAARRNDYGRTSPYAAATCERQLNMCFVRCNSTN